MAPWEPEAAEMAGATVGMVVLAATTVLGLRIIPEFDAEAPAS